ncbi:MAG: rhodanese-like domain-containing protein [Cyclobacteriaceae bacterium]|nr:rhodanese-like domain-containing protein [Cyclobacteriaceae bacterium]
MEKKIFTASFIIGLFCLTACGQNDFDKKLNSLYKKTVPLIHAQELSKNMTENKEIVLLDTRSAEEYEISHLQNAHFVDYDTFSAKAVEQFDRDAKIIVYCAVGYRSERIGEKLLEMGFKDVKNLYGGIFEWVNEGHTIVNKSGMVTDSVHTYNMVWSRWLEKGVKVY